jgi:DNA-binding transcriptional LysR family regulator
MPRKPAKIPEVNWHDLRVVLALARADTLAAAARRLGVDETTVARRLAAAEAALRARLFERIASGALRPTDAGEAAIRHAEHIEREIGALLGEVAGADDTAAGTVRLTAVPILVNRVLVPALPRLHARHPALRVELVAEPRDLSLTQREADLALRLNRPRDAAGSPVLARKLGLLDYAIYVPSSCRRGKEAALPWVSYDESMAALPQARWIAAAASRSAAPLAPLAVNDAEALLQAVHAGFGKSLLPRAIADREKGLRRFDDDAAPHPPSREIWLLTHPDQRPLARIAAVIEWLEETLHALGIRS